MDLYSYIVFNSVYSISWNFESHLNRFRSKEIKENNEKNIFYIFLIISFAFLLLLLLFCLHIMRNLDPP